MFKRVFSIIITVLVTGNVAYADWDYTLSCPDSVKIEKRGLDLVDDGSKGWETLDRNNVTLYLDSAQIFIGKPDNRIERKPPPLYIKAPDRLWRWNVRSEIETENIGYWLSCSYNNDEIQRYQRIASHMKRCRVDRTTDPYYRTHIKVSCESKQAK